jgi:hypothetical protein
VRAKLRQTGMLDGDFGSLLVHSLIALCFDELEYRYMRPLARTRPDRVSALIRNREPGDNEKKEITIFLTGLLFLLIAVSDGLSSVLGTTPIPFIHIGTRHRTPTSEEAEKA